MSSLRHFKFTLNQWPGMLFRALLYERMTHHFLQCDCHVRWGSWNAAKETTGFYCCLGLTVISSEFMFLWRFPKQLTKGKHLHNICNHDFLRPYSVISTTQSYGLHFTCPPANIPQMRISVMVMLLLVTTALAWVHQKEDKVGYLEMTSRNRNEWTVGKIRGIRVIVKSVTARNNSCLILPRTSEEFFEMSLKSCLPRL